MKEFYSTIDATRKNYLIVSPEHGGRVHIAHDCKTDDELGEVADYFDFNKISALSVGESCTFSDGGSIIVRIA